MTVWMNMYSTIARMGLQDAGEPAQDRISTEHGRLSDRRSFQFRGIGLSGSRLASGGASFRFVAAGLYGRFPPVRNVDRPAISSSPK
jgi:hypothetical protein